MLPRVLVLDGQGTMPATQEEAGGLAEGPQPQGHRHLSVRPAPLWWGAGGRGRSILLVQHAFGDGFPGNFTRTCDSEL